jgi:predicted ATPase
LVLNRLRRHPEAKRAILDNLQQLYPGIEDYDVSIEGGTVQVFLQERGFTIPATRLSDGTLRYLCLLTILCHPNPPPLVCIEEPELGLHPDLMPTIARLLKAASERTQLVVTTHSDLLVDAFTEEPESVVVCDRSEGQTTMRRLSEKKLKAWLEDYRLGQLWMQGGIGGVRW